MSPTTTWSAVLDSLIAGLAHALSNRVATLGAMGVLLDPGEGAEGRALETLEQETQRLEEFVELMRMLPAERGESLEAIELSSVVSRVLTLHHLHRDLRELPVRVADGAPVPPVRARRTALTHALLMVLADGARRLLAGGAAAPSPLVTRYESDEREVRINVEAAGESGADADELRALMLEAGGTVIVERDRHVLVLPTLAEARRRSSGGGMRAVDG